MSGTGHDRNLTVFSPEGRLFQIEYAIKATKCEGLTTVGICGKDAAVIVTQKKLPDRLVDPSSITHFHRINKHTGCCQIGIPADGHQLAYRGQYYASKFELKFGYEMPPSLVARRVGDFQQLLTQHASNRPFATVFMYIGWDEIEGPQLWRSDPAGSVVQFKVCAAGEKEQEAFNNLEKKKINLEMNKDEIICAAIDCLQNVTSSEFRPEDMEIALVTAEKKEFHVLDIVESERYLTMVSDKD